MATSKWHFSEEELLGGDELDYSQAPKKEPPKRRIPTIIISEPHHPNANEVEYFSDSEIVRRTDKMEFYGAEFERLSKESRTLAKRIRWIKQRLSEISTKKEI
jgi:hypothetical protein